MKKLGPCGQNWYVSFLYGTCRYGPTLHLTDTDLTKHHLLSTKSNLYLVARLRIEHRHHNIDLVPIVHVGVGHNVVVALRVDVQLVVVVVVVIQVVVDVDDDGEDVERGGQKGHLSNAEI